jgi:hypothetical protein
MALHETYTNIHKKVLRVTDALFRARPWSGTDDEILNRWQAWCDKACDAYGIPHVEVLMTRSDVPYHGAYLPESRCIVLRKWSLITLFHEFRHHMQCTQDLHYAFEEAFEIDAQAWACSLFHSVRPGRFRRAVESGRVKGVGPGDLAPQNAAQGPLAADCELPAEQREAFEQLAEELLESLEPDEDLAVLLDELNGEDGAV